MASTNGDRRVHAEHPDGTQVVRYDKAGKWYVERAGDPRQAVTIAQAVREALRPSMRVRLGVPGGATFDRLYSGAWQ